MNQEDIIRMAREAGINVEQGFLLRFAGVEQDLERFAALVAEHVAAAEREACAKVCSDLAMHRDVGSYGMLVAHSCANEILARGKS